MNPKNYQHLKNFANINHLVYGKFHEIYLFFWFQKGLQSRAEARSTFKILNFCFTSIFNFCIKFILTNDSVELKMSKYTVDSNFEISFAFDQKLS